MSHYLTSIKDVFFEATGATWIEEMQDVARDVVHIVTEREGKTVHFEIRIGHLVKSPLNPRWVMLAALLHAYAEAEEGVEK